MTTLQERCRIAEQCLPDAPYREMLRKLHDEMLAALAQQGEQQPSAYLTIADTGDMVWPPEAYDEACTYCDDDENPVPLYTAAPAPQPTSGDYALGYAEGFNDACKPAPQAQDGTFINEGTKSAPQPAQGDVAETAIGVLSARRGFDEWWDGIDEELQAEIAQEIRDTLQSAQPVAQPNIRLSDDEIFAIAHRTATRYTHFVQPGQVMYGFAQHHMIDLVRAIEAAHCIGEFK